MIEAQFLPEEFLLDEGEVDPDATADEEETEDEDPAVEGTDSDADVI